MDSKSLGSRIQYARKLKGLTQEELAKHARISTMSIRRYESGARIPTEDTIFDIAHALNVSFRWLLTGEGRYCPDTTDLISSALEKRGLSVTQLSAMTDIPVNHLFSIIHKSIYPTSDDIKRISSALGIDTNLFMNGCTIDKRNRTMELTNTDKFELGLKNVSDAAKDALEFKIKDLLGGMNIEELQSAIEFLEFLYEKSKSAKSEGDPSAVAPKENE